MNCHFCSHLMEKLPFECARGAFLCPSCSQNFSMKMISFFDFDEEIFYGHRFDLLKQKISFCFGKGSNFYFNILEIEKFDENGIGLWAPGKKRFLESSIQFECHPSEAAERFESIFKLRSFE